MPAQFQAFVDQGVSPPGTSLASVTLNGLVISQSCLITGGLPPTSGSLILTQPATTAVVNTGSAAAYVAPSSQALTFTASKDTYVDLSTSGTYTLAAVANNAGAPSVTANSARLYKAVSGASAVTSILPLIPNVATTNSGPTPVSPLAVSAPDESSATYNSAVLTAYPLAATDTLQQTIWRLVKQAAGAMLQTLVGYDSTEAATTSGSSTLVDNMNHARYPQTVLVGSTWSAALANTKKAILQDGTNAAGAVALPGTLSTGGALTVSAGGAAITGAITVNTSIAFTGTNAATLLSMRTSGISTTSGTAAVAAGTTISQVNTGVGSGINAYDLAIPSCDAVLPTGVFLSAVYAGTNSWNITITNTTGSLYTLPNGTNFRLTVFHY